MRERRTIVLSDEERKKLKAMTGSHREPYERRHATAILLIADGKSGYWVAKYGLDKPVHHETVYEWLNRYIAEGIAGLAIRPGRGRKPARLRQESQGTT